MRYSYFTIFLPCLLALTSCASEHTLYPSPDAVLGTYKEVGALSRPTTLVLAKLELKVTKNSLGTFKYMKGLYVRFGLGSDLVAGYFSYSSPQILSDFTGPLDIATVYFFPGNHTTEDSSTFTGFFRYDSSRVVNLKLGSIVEDGKNSISRQFIKIQ